MQALPVTQAVYNAKLQEFQELPLVTRLEHRPGSPCAYFQVYWNEWQTLGTQCSPLTSHATYEWNEARGLRILLEMSRELVR